MIVTANAVSDLVRTISSKSTLLLLMHILFTVCVWLRRLTSSLQTLKKSGMNKLLLHDNFLTCDVVSNERITHEQHDNTATIFVLYENQSKCCIIEVKQQKNVESDVVCAQ